jgi:hypothetical protein
MWTDMSEIVRPTRDGIHGREYISTVVDLGRHPIGLKFDNTGNLISKPMPMVSLPVPILLDLPPFGDLSTLTLQAMAKAAERLDTRFIVPEAQARELGEYTAHIIPLIESDLWDSAWISQFPMVEVLDSPDVPVAKTLEKVFALKAIKRDLVVSVRIQARMDQADRTLQLAQGEVDVVHIKADRRGYEPAIDNGHHIKDVVRSHHALLLQEGLRDEITIISGGGVTMAEHVIKSMLCGANAVSVDVPMLIALECRVCRNCVEGGGCPVKMSTVDPTWGSQRIVNLMGAWHNQLLEMMGAMGIREARRLRGEQGRALFVEDLEEDTFARLFGQSES